MKHSQILIVVLLLLLTSCAEKYVIEGTSSQFIKDGTKAYILSLDDSTSEQPFDSCEVLHGQFHMTGAVDSVMLVRLKLGEDNFPIVIEQGQLFITIENNQVKIEGTDLNDRLYKFLTQTDSIRLLYDDLPHRESLMYLDGYSSDEIVEELAAEEVRLQNELDRIETRFVCDNFDNTLGQTWFLRMCYDAEHYYGFPTTTPQIDEIYLLAPDSFKQNPRIVEYMNRVNGQ